MGTTITPLWLSEVSQHMARFSLSQGKPKRSPLPEAMGGAVVLGWRPWGDAYTRAIRLPASWFVLPPGQEVGLLPGPCREGQMEEQCQELWGSWQGTGVRPDAVTVL